MQRKRRKTKNLVIVFALIIACIYVGYSLITSNLQVRTSLDVAKTSFDVHFENVKINEESTIETLPTLSEDKTKLSFNITLNAPGDSYIINADIYNAGTIDAVINDLSLEGMDSAISETLTTKMIYTIDNATVAKNDLIKSGEIETIKIEIAYPYSSDDTESDLLAEPLSANILFNIEYAKPDAEKLNNNEYNIRPFRAYNYISSNAVLDNIKSKYVTSSDGIDFSKTSSDTNGKGIYTIGSTANDTYPISYYRGDVDNNYVIVNNYCWKIVRTTSTGGIKLLFADYPNSDGTCNSQTYFGENNTFLITNFNYSSEDNAYVGYMYGEEGSSTYEETHRNTYDSKALYTLKEFYNDGNKNLNNYSEDNRYTSDYVSIFNENILEKAEYCNDRSLADITSDSDFFEGQNFNNLGYSKNNTLYSGYKRATKTFKPTLTCQNDNDKFINYYGLLTIDETMYAGLSFYPNTIENNYLNFNDNSYWLMTPFSYCEGERDATEFIVASSPESEISIGASTVNTYPYVYIRPVIALNNKARIYKGDGTSKNPYMIKDSALYLLDFSSIEIHS